MDGTGRNGSKLPRSGAARAPGSTLATIHTHEQARLVRWGGADLLQPIEARHAGGNPTVHYV